MKIAIVTLLFDRRGGSERRTYQLVKELLRLGHSVEVFAAKVEDMDLDAAVNIVPVSPGPSFVKVSSFARNVAGMLSARPDFDVVHNQIRPFTDGVVTVGGGCHAEYLERSGKSFAFINPLHRVILGMERERYRAGGCRAVITNSRLAKDGILKHYDYPEDRVFVAYNGVDLARFRPVNTDEERRELKSRLGMGGGPVMLFTGSGFERKGLMTAIRALGALKDAEGGLAGLRLAVVGRDSAVAYEKAARSLGVGDRVLFAGAVRNPEDYCRAADMFVLPTLFDPFSNAALEAMASGIPVITTHQNGVREIIDEGVSGFLMEDPADDKRLAVIIEGLAEQQVRDRVGAAARKAAERMTWEATAAATVGVYRKVYGL